MKTRGQPRTGRIAALRRERDKGKPGESRRRKATRLRRVNRAPGQHSATVLWLLFTATTGVIAVLASLNLLTVNQAAFTPLWTTFAVSFGALIVTVLKAQWQPVADTQDMPPPGVSVT